jgi:hypothetical protein
MLRSWAIAICCGALVSTLSPVAFAQVALVERVRVQGGFLTEKRPAPQERLDDWHAGVIPELSLVSISPRTAVSVTYGFSGALHTTYPNQIGHSLTLDGRFDLSPRTTLITSAFLSKSTLTNRLLTQPVAGTPTTLLPTGSSTDTVTATVGQGLAYEVSPNVRAEQHTSGTFFTALEPAPPLDSFAVVLGGSVERVWERDAVGPEASIGYSAIRAAPPFPDQDFILGNAGPHWRHDWSRTISTLVAGGAATLVSPNGSAETVIAPFARGSFLYTIDTGLGWSVTASTGVTPNPLTGQAIQAHQAAFNAFAPISTAHQIYASATVGYLRGALVDLAGSTDQGFHAANADIEIAWRPSDRVQIFGRYTFLAQIVDDASSPNVALPSFLRDSFLVGFSLSSHPPDIGAGRRGRGRAGVGEGTQFPQRVDRADGARGGGGGGGDENAPDAERRPRPPEGVNGTRWITTTPARPPEDQDRDPLRR